METTLLTPLPLGHLQIFLLNYENVKLCISYFDLKWICLFRISIGTKQMEMHCGKCWKYAIFRIISQLCEIFTLTIYFDLFSLLIPDLEIEQNECGGWDTLMKIIGAKL